MKQTLGDCIPFFRMLFQHIMEIVKRELALIATGLALAILGFCLSHKFSENFGFWIGTAILIFGICISMIYTAKAMWIVRDKAK